MSLRDQFVPDLDVIFMNVGEMAEWREFRINDGHGSFLVFKARCVWDKEMAKQQPVVARMGVYLGDVVCYIMARDLPRVPVAGELIYSPANQPWEVLDHTIEENCYRLVLAAYRSQPAHYGAN